MTNAQNAPSPPEDFSDGSVLFPTETPPSDELVHSKVPFGPWLSESFTFYGRYFWRNLLWFGLIVAVLDVIPTYLLQGTAGPEAKALATLSRPSHHDSHKNSASDFNSSFSMDEKQDAIMVLLKSPLFWISMVIGIFSALFHLMVLNWGIKTIQTGNISARNLWFSSVWTIPKIVAAGFLAALLAMGVVFIMFFGFTFGMAMMPFGVILILFLGTFCFWFIFRYSFFTEFILDRDFSPIKSINASAAFMKNNFSTFLGGLLLLGLLIWGMTSLPLNLFNETYMMNAKSAPANGTELTRIPFSPILMILQFIVKLLVFPFQTGFLAVFYLMMTGQRRPGVWPRESGDK